MLVVRSEDGRQVLVPTAREIMTEVDREARRIVIDAIPGLVDAGQFARADEACCDEEHDEQHAGGAAQSMMQSSVNHFNNPRVVLHLDGRPVNQGG